MKIVAADYEIPYKISILNSLFSVLFFCCLVPCRLLSV